MSGLCLKNLSTVSRSRPLWCTSHLGSKLSNNSISFLSLKRYLIIQLILIKMIIWFSKSMQCTPFQCSGLLVFFTACFISSAGFLKGGTNTLRHAWLHVCICAYRGVWLLSTHTQLAQLNNLPFGMNACAHTNAIFLSSCVLRDTYVIGSPSMQRVPKPGLFTKVSTTWDTSTLSGPSLLQI